MGTLYLFYDVVAPVHRPRAEAGERTGIDLILTFYGSSVLQASNTRQVVVACAVQRAVGADQRASAVASWPAAMQHAAYGRAPLHLGPMALTRLTPSSAVV
jgi:hypothetical protein